MTNAEIKIEKKGSRWWLVKHTDDWPFRSNVFGCQTKREATTLRAALLGDAIAAKKWYRLHLTQWLKNFSEKEAADATAHTAEAFGFYPEYVGADPNTFLPVENLEGES